MRIPKGKGTLSCEETIKYESERLKAYNGKEKGILMN